MVDWYANEGLVAYNYKTTEIYIAFLICLRIPEIELYPREVQTDAGYGLVKSAYHISLGKNTFEFLNQIMRMHGHLDCNHTIILIHTTSAVPYMHIRRDFDTKHTSSI